MKNTEESIDIPEDDGTEQRKIEIAERKQQLEERKAANDQALKNRQLGETERHNKAAESIQRSKPKTSK